MSNKTNHIDYIEFMAKNLEDIKVFYSTVFGWSFTDYGPGYVSFSGSGLEGGFEKTKKEIVNGVLVVIYHEDLERSKEKVVEAGGEIIKDVFSFPGGKRFQFKDPSGNELAVWSDKI